MHSIYIKQLGNLLKLIVILSCHSISKMTTNLNLYGMQTIHNTQQQIESKYVYYSVYTINNIAICCWTRHTPTTTKTIEHNIAVMCVVYLYRQVIYAIYYSIQQQCSLNYCWLHIHTIISCNIVQVALLCPKFTIFIFIGMYIHQAQMDRFQTYRLVLLHINTDYSENNIHNIVEVYVVRLYYC